MPQNCFFTTRKDDKDILRMCPLCIKCGPKCETAFFWEGSSLGYGKHKIICGDCQHVIHDPFDSEATKKSSN